MTTHHYQSYMGIDVSKARLDIGMKPGDESWSVSNDDDGITELLNRLDSKSDVLVVLEATGGLELPVATALVAIDIVACMRKLLTILNAMVRNKTYWQDKYCPIYA